MPIFICFTTFRPPRITCFFLSHSSQVATYCTIIFDNEPPLSVIRIEYAHCEAKVPRNPLQLYLLSCGYAYDPIES